MERGGHCERCSESRIGSTKEERTHVADSIIRAIMLDHEASAALCKSDQITWLKGAIGLDTARGASEISDRELMIRYIEGGRFEWDPQVAAQVALYLKSQGFHWTP